MWTDAKSYRVSDLKASAAIVGGLEARGGRSQPKSRLHGRASGRAEALRGAPDRASRLADRRRQRRRVTLRHDHGRSRRRRTTLPIPPARRGHDRRAGRQRLERRSSAGRRRCRRRRAPRGPPRHRRRRTSAATSSCDRLPRKRTRSATPAASARGLAVPPAGRRRRRSPGARRASCASVASIRYSNPFLRTSRPAAKTSGASAPRPSPRADCAARVRRRRETRRVDAVRDDFQCDPASAPSAIARRARSSLHAVTSRRAANTRRAAAPAGGVRSATNTSDPCRLTTSGSAGRAAAAITPPGTTQCPCITVARRFCATRIALNQPGRQRQRRRHHAAPLQLHVGAQPGRVAEDVQRGHGRVAGRSGRTRRPRPCRGVMRGCHGATRCTSCPRAATRFAIGSMKVPTQSPGKRGYDVVTITTTWRMSGARSGRRAATA